MFREYIWQGSWMCDIIDMVVVKSNEDRKREGLKQRVLDMDCYKCGDWV